MMGARRLNGAQESGITGSHDGGAVVADGGNTVSDHGAGGTVVAREEMLIRDLADAATGQERPSGVGGDSETHLGTL